MNNFEQIFSVGIPLHEAARFFVGLKKTANQPAEPPDETGMLEGQFCAPVEQVLAAMGKQVQNEFETHMSYKVYAQTLRDLSHGAIAEEFEAHAGEEMDHADFLLRRMAALGGPAHIPDVQAPAASADPVEIIKRMIRMEQEAIANWRELRQMVGDGNPSAIAIDDYMLKEQEHTDDLWLLLPHTERAMMPAQPGVAPEMAPPQAEPVPSPAPPQAEAPKQNEKAAAAMGSDDHVARGMAAYKQVAQQRGIHPGAEELMAMEHGLRQARPTAGLAQQHTNFYNDEIGAEPGESPDISRYNAAVMGRASLEGAVPTASKADLAAFKAHPDLAYALRHLDRSGMYAPDFKPSKVYGGETKAAELRFKVAAAMLKQAYHSEYSSRHADPYYYDPYSAEMVQHMREQAEVQGLQGRLRQAQTPEHQEAIKQQYAQDHIESGQIGGALSGAMVGGVGLGALGHAIGDGPGAVIGGLGGAALGGYGGYHLGGWSGKRHAKDMTDRAYAGVLPVNQPPAAAKEVPPETAPDVKAAEMRFKVAAAMLKQAAEMLDSAGVGDAAGTPSGPDTSGASALTSGGPTAPDAGAGQYLQQEQMALEAQNQNEANFYKQQLQQSTQQLQQAQQSAQAQQQQMDQMNQQLQGMQGQIDTSMQQAQQTQQQATQNAQAAQAAATQAMQQTMTANSELMNQQQLSANMRNAYQQLQQQVMQVAQNAPPPPATTMEAGMAQAAPMGSSTGLGVQEQAGMPPDQGGAEATGAGQPGGAAGPGAPPAGGPAPGGQGPEAAGGQSVDNTQPTMTGAAPQGEQTPPQAEAEGAPKQGSVKMSDLEQYLTAAKGHAPAIIGAGVGAAGGAMLPFALKGGDEELADLRQRVADQEANKADLGWQQELGLIKNKAQLGLEEMAQKHPAAAHIMGAATGAGVGAVGGTAVGEVLKNHKLNTSGY